jgi:geranylgeranyl diphosphate synthase type II
VKAIYNALNIPALAEKKVNHYFDKGFKSLDQVACAPERKAALRKFAEDLIGRQV